MYKEQPIKVACAGCGRTQSVRKSKVTPCEGYTCGLDCCKLNPDFKLPETPSGYIRQTIFGAAGSFFGWKFCVPTNEELQGMEGAKAIRDAGIRQLSDERVRKLLDF